MATGTTQDEEQILQQLVINGNDEVATRLVLALLNAPPGQNQQRGSLLYQLGERYLILALRQGSEDDNALMWYEEARNNLLAAIATNALLAQAAFDAHLWCACISAVLHDDEQASSQCEHAQKLAIEPRQEVEVLFARSLVLLLCHLGNEGLVRQAFVRAKSSRL